LAVSHGFFGRDAAEVEDAPEAEVIAVCEGIGAEVDVAEEEGAASGADEDATAAAASVYAAKSRWP
jgi:hypothetical protein